MAEHHELTDRELSAALAALTPRRSSMNREHLLYLAGRAAAQSEHRRGRAVSLAAAAAGWLAAALSLGLWSVPREGIVDSNAVSRPEEVPGPMSPAGADRPALAERDTPQPATVRRTEAASLPVADRLAMSGGLERISRTGRLIVDRPRERASAPLDDSDSGARPATYRELMRDWSSGEDLL